VLTAEKDRVAWDERWRLGGADAFRIGRAGGLLVAEWPGVARLTCGHDGGRARFVAQPGADPAHVEKLRHGAVQALLGDVRGELGLHASAVAVDGRALLVVGASGAGKSTTAGDLCLRHGARLLADDIAMLDIGAEGVRVRPTERHHSLTAESLKLLGVGKPRRAPDGVGRSRAPRGRKVMLREARSRRASYPVALIAVLRADGRRREPLVRPLSGASAARALLPSILRFDFRAERRRELDQVFAMYEKCRVVEVVRPARSARESLVGGKLLSLLEGNGRS
jgi:hypothetical protein